MQRILASSKGFAALKGDCTVVAWGDVQDVREAADVRKVVTEVWVNKMKDGTLLALSFTDEALAALRADGSVLTWGASKFGGDSSNVQFQLHRVKHIYSNRQSFVALKIDGSVVAWGNQFCGGDCSTVMGKLINVKEILVWRYEKPESQIPKQFPKVSLKSNSVRSFS